MPKGQPRWPLRPPRRVGLRREREAAASHGALLAHSVAPAVAAPGLDCRWGVPVEAPEGR